MALAALGLGCVIAAMSAACTGVSPVAADPPAQMISEPGPVPVATDAAPAPKPPTPQADATPAPKQPPPPDATPPLPRLVPDARAPIPPGRVPRPRP